MASTVAIASQAAVAVDRRKAKFGLTVPQIGADVRRSRPEPFYVEPFERHCLALQLLPRATVRPGRSGGSAA
ncbi:hypothetical protein [Streptomyces bullii]|uniref:Uncharacterized protein n=1 Tax=Streptomyces bullii TaxID=349910 RepID=A0ABW0V2L0_9ACTN